MEHRLSSVIVATGKDTAAHLRGVPGGHPVRNQKVEPAGRVGAALSLNQTGRRRPQQQKLIVGKW